MMKMLKQFTLLSVVVVLATACLKDIADTNNRNFPITLQLQKGSGLGISWSRLNSAGFTSYLVTSTAVPSEVYSRIADIPTNSILTKIIDVDKTSYMDTTAYESSYYRIYGVIEGKLYVSNEVFWQSNVLNLTPIGEYTFDAEFDDVNNKLVIKSYKGLNLFDPVSRKLTVNQPYTFKKNPDDLRQVVVKDLGRGNEIFVSESNHIYVFDPTSLSIKDTIPLVSYATGWFASMDSIFHVFGAKMNTYDRKSRKSIASNVFASSIYNLGYTSSDELITSTYQGVNYYKYDRKSTTFLSTELGFKGVAPYTFDLSYPYISKDGEYALGINSSGIFAYDKYKKLFFGKKHLVNPGVYDLQVTPNGEQLLAVPKGINGNFTIEVYNFKNSDMDKQIYSTKLQNFDRMVVTNKYIFVFAQRLNRDKSSMEPHLETIEL